MYTFDKNKWFYSNFQMIIHFFCDFLQIFKFIKVILSNNLEIILIQAMEPDLLSLIKPCIT